MIFTCFACIVILFLGSNVLSAMVIMRSTKIYCFRLIRSLSGGGSLKIW